MNTTPLQPVQRSEPAASAGAGRRPASESERERDLQPGASAPGASLTAFEHALQRAADSRVPLGKPRGSRAGVDDADERDAGAQGQDAGGYGTDASATPSPLSTPLPQAVPNAAPLRAAISAPAWSPRAAQPLDAVSTQLNALQLPLGSGVRSAWQLQLLDRSLPVQQLDIQRTAAGALRLALGASPETARSAPLERLRQRLVARGNAPESLVYRQAHEELDS